MQQRHGLVDELLDWKALAGAQAEGGRISGFKAPSVECGWRALVRRGDRIYQMTMQVITERQPDRAAAGLYVQDLLPKLVDRGEA